MKSEEKYYDRNKISELSNKIFTFKMTNKQRLIKVIRYFGNCHYGLFKKPENVNEDVKELFKALEVLEILKKYMWFSFHEELGFQVFCNDTINLGNEEEFNLLKEYFDDTSRT